MVLRTVINVSDKTVLVLDAIAEGGVRPAFLGIVALIFESGAVDVVNFLRRVIDWIVGCVDARRVAGIKVVVAIQVVESREAVLPSMRRGDGQLHAAQQTVQLRGRSRIRLQRH